MKIVWFLLLWSSLFSQKLIEYGYEADIYYSNISAYLDLDTANELQDASLKSEKQIYKELIQNTFHPNVFLTELAIHPMPITGIYLKSEQREFYDKFEFDNFNPIRSITAGFEEPYSLSFFFGRMILFSKAKDLSIKNRAFIGYLFSIGNYTIKDNSAYENKWLRMEFKLKGTRSKKTQDLDWSFRIGTQLNHNNSFANTLYIGARRSKIQYTKNQYSFINNGAINSLLEVNYNFELTKAELVYEKILPVKLRKKSAFKLGIGYVYDSSKRYNGNLRQSDIINHQLVIRPNLKF